MYGVLLQIILWIISIRKYQADHNFPEGPQTHSSEPMDQEFTAHGCEVQVEGLQEIIHFQQKMIRLKCSLL